MLRPYLGPRVTIERIRGLFGNAGPVQDEIWESQFDGCDEVLRRLARTPWEDLFGQSFWVYFHDLNDVDLQPEVFRYLFPACLVMAQKRLMSGYNGLDAGDSDFMKSLASRKWTKVCTPEQMQGTDDILTDGFIDRLEEQRGFEPFEEVGDLADPISRYNWIGRLNSLGCILPSIEPLWTKWWVLNSPGSAVAALEYAWALAESNRASDVPFPVAVRWLAAPDTVDALPGWRKASLDFLASTLGYDYLLEKVARAVAMLDGEPEAPTARNIADKVAERRPLVEARIEELFHNLQPKGGVRWYSKLPRL